MQDMRKHIEELKAIMSQNEERRRLLEMVDIHEETLLGWWGGRELGDKPEYLEHVQDSELRDDPERCALRDAAIAKMLRDPDICAISWNWRIGRATYFSQRGEMNNTNTLHRDNPSRRDAKGNRMKKKNEPGASTKHTWHTVYLKKT